jgi:MraZ protein
MFRGNIPTRVDDKGRLKLPADFKRLIDEHFGTQFFITSRDGKRAEIWPMKEWQKIEAKLETIPNSEAFKRKFLDRVNYYGQMAEMDAQGRLLIPQLLRETAKLDGDSDVLGRLDHLEIVNHEDFKAEVDLKPWTEADDEKMSSIGL